MKLKISNMTGKLKDIQAINTNTLSNDFCQKESQSNNPDKISQIKKGGIKVIDTVQIKVKVEAEAKSYMETKKIRSGHNL